VPLFLLLAAARQLKSDPLGRVITMGLRMGRPALRTIMVIVLVGLSACAPPGPTARQVADSLGVFGAPRRLGPFAKAAADSVFALHVRAIRSTLGSPLTDCPATWAEWRSADGSMFVSEVWPDEPPPGQADAGGTAHWFVLVGFAGPRSETPCHAA